MYVRALVQSPISSQVRALDQRPETHPCRMNSRPVPRLRFRVEGSTTELRSRAEERCPMMTSTRHQ